MQSDYIQYKAMSHTLYDEARLPPVLAAGAYTNYLSYSLENTIVNTKQVNSQLTPPNKTSIYGMEMVDVSGCPTFIVCQGTDQRSNRVALGGCNQPRPLTQPQIATQIGQLFLCKCSVNR
jgi:hypothetical protein